MAEEKGVSKNILFNYFVGYLTIDNEIYIDNDRKANALEIIHNKLKDKKKLTERQKQILSDEATIKEKKRIYDECGRTKWSALKMFKQIKEKSISTTITIDKMPIEIEPGTLKIDEYDKIVTFQLSKLRSDMLPSKKKIEKQKEDIELEDDEYIGEFTSVLYDETNHVFMVQSNTYGVFTSQIEKYLTLLRRRVIEETNSDEIMELACELSVIVGNYDIKSVGKSKEVKKVRFRAADGVYDALSTDENNYFARVRKSINDRSGFVIDITVSINRDSEIKTMDDDILGDIAKNFDIIKKCDYDSNLLVEVTRKENDTSRMELINLLSPRMTEIIRITMKPRTSVAQEFLSAKMLDAYRVTKSRINMVLG